MARVGRLLFTAAILGTGPSFAWFDLRRTHIFNPRWTPHARFHDASAVNRTGLVDRLPVAAVATGNN